MEWSTQSSVIELADTQYLGWSDISHDTVYALNQRPKYDAIALVVKTHGFSAREVQLEMVLLIIILNSPREALGCLHRKQSWFYCIGSLGCLLNMWGSSHR